MQPVHVPPAQRSLLDRPQRLGFLPTWWFWNDHERHRLALPLVLLVTLPWMPVLFYLVVRLQLPFAVFVIVNTLAPYLGMGLIERHIRRELHRRALVGPELGEELVHTSPPDLSASSSPQAARRLCLALAGLGGLGTALAVGQMWGAFPAAMCLLTLAILVGAAWSASPRARALPPAARRVTLKSDG